MTDLTTRTAATGTPVSAPPTVVTDLRTLRHTSRAEQDRLSADAEVDRRARAARLALELREQQLAHARRERQADVEDRQARAERRRFRRAQRRAGVRLAAPRWAEGTLFILPILFPMAVAWAGQIRFAMSVMHWPLPAAVVFAAGFELSTAYVARLDWRSRAAGDNALLFRAATWAFAAGAAVMNYWHAAGPGLAPNGEAVSYGLMSLTGVILWELWSTYRHRTALRAEGKLPAARPRFGLARWIWFANLTYLAWLIALRDGYPTTDLAWRAGLGAIDQYGSARCARKAVRAGRPVARPAPVAVESERDLAGGIAENPDAGDRDGPGHADRNERDPERDRQPAVVAGTGRPGCAAQRDQRDQRDRRVDGRAAAAERTPPTAAGAGALANRMAAYARVRLAEGTVVTGAELDREFGTHDYGRKVLRRLSADRSG